MDPNVDPPLEIIMILSKRHLIDVSMLTIYTIRHSIICICKISGKSLHGRLDKPNRCHHLIQLQYI